MTVRKIPMRHCVGCGAEKPKAELCRVLRTPEGNIEIDITGKKNGRGAYLCREISCLRKAKKNGRLARNLETEIPEEIILRLESEFGES